MYEENYEGVNQRHDRNSVTDFKVFIICKRQLQQTRIAGATDRTGDSG